MVVVMMVEMVVSSYSVGGGSYGDNDGGGWCHVVVEGFHM